METCLIEKLFEILKEEKKISYSKWAIETSMPKSSLYDAVNLGTSISIEVLEKLLQSCGDDLTTFSLTLELINYHSNHYVSKKNIRKALHIARDLRKKIELPEM